MQSIPLPTGAAAARSRPPAAGALWDLLVGRAGPAIVMGLLFAGQVTHVQGAMSAVVRTGGSITAVLSAANTAMILLYFALLIILFVTRLPPRARDRRPWIVAVSFTASYCVMYVPFLPSAGRRDWLLLPSDLLALAGVGFTLWSLLYLGRSFSILPQARRLVTSGPYGVSRNPVYLGEVAGAWAAYLPTLGWLGALVLAANIGLLMLRVRAEERVLAGALGAEYAAYCERVPRFVPWPWRRRTTAVRSSAAVPGPTTSRSAISRALPAPSSSSATASSRLSSSECTSSTPSENTTSVSPGSSVTVDSS